MPVRSVTNRYGGTHIIGQFPSFKMGRALQFESTLEMDCLYLLDYDKLVSHIEVQPLTIPYMNGQRKHHYTPDILVHFHHRKQTLLLECKPADKVTQSVNQRKFKAAEAWCHERDIRFAVVTEETLRTGSYLHNVKHLAQFARHPIQLDIHLKAKQILATGHDMLLDELAKAIFPEIPARVKSPLLTLLYHQHLKTDLNCASISGLCNVYLPSVSEDHHDSKNIHPFRALLLGRDMV